MPPTCGECAHETKPERVVFEGDPMDSQSPCAPIFRERKEIVNPKPDMECPHPEHFEPKERS